MFWSILYMKNILIILTLISLVFIAGCQRGITGSAVLEQDQTTVVSTSIQPSTVEPECEQKFIRKHILLNGTVTEYCAKNLIERERCEFDTGCGRDAVCEAGYCRPVVV